MRLYAGVHFEHSYGESVGVFLTRLWGSLQNHGGRGARPVAVGKSSPASTPETTSSSAGSWRTAAGRNIPSSGLTAGTIGSGSSSLKETSFTPAAAAASAAAGSGEPASQIPASPAEDPTAPNDTIVIKNLPYALTKEDIEKYLVWVVCIKPTSLLVGSSTQLLYIFFVL